MNRRSGVAWGLALAVVAGVATAPLSLLVGGSGIGVQGLSAIEASGSVWRGELRSASWRGQPLGDVAVRLQPLPLLLGQGRLRIESASWQGTLVDGRRQGLLEGSGTLTLPTTALLAGATAELSMQEAVLVFEDQRCREAGGRLQATLRMDDPAMPELRLSGTVSCAQEQGRAVLASEADAPLRLEAVLTIAADGRYRLQSTARAQDAASKLALQLAGFDDTPSGLVRTDSGHLAR